MIVSLLMFVLLLAPITAAAQTPAIDPALARSLDIIENQNARIGGLFEGMLALTTAAMKQSATVAAPTVDAAVLDRLSRLAMSIQAGQQIAASAAVPEKKGFWSGAFLHTVVPAVGSGLLGYAIGNHVGDNKSFNRAAELVSRMPNPIQNIHLSSFSGGSTSRTFVGGSRISSNTSLNPSMSLNNTTNATTQGGNAVGGGGTGGTSSASANPFVIAGGGQGGAGGTSSANPLVLAGGGQGGGGGQGFGSSSSSANPFVEVIGGGGGTGLGGSSSSGASGSATVFP